MGTHMTVQPVLTVTQEEIRIKLEKRRKEVFGNQ